MMLWVAGWGFRSGADRSSFASCWEQANQRLDLAQLESARWTFAVLESRVSKPGWQQLLAWKSGSVVPHADCVQIAESDISKTETPTNSERLEQRFGTGSVCEAVAWQAALQRADQREVQWMLPRIVSADRQATLAVVRIGSLSELQESGVLS